MRTTRRTFVTGAAAATAAAGLSPALAAEELKLHSFVPPTHVIWTDVLAPWAQRWRKRSNNELTVRLFPAMQLGGRPPDLYRQVVQGITDIDLHAARLHVGRLPDDGADRTARHRQQRRRRHQEAVGATSTSFSRATSRTPRC